MKKVIIIISSIVIFLLVLAIGGYFVLKYILRTPNISLSITYPKKTMYYVGEASEFEDLKVQIFDKEYIDINNYEISGFDSSKAIENQKITISVSYKETTYYAYFYVTIKEVPKPNPILSEIVLSVLPTKQVYKVGDYFSPDGGVLDLVYDDGSVKRINLLRSYVYGFDSSIPNDSLELTVKYKELGIVYTTTFTVKVVE